jgi:hypothetical protein
VVPLVVSLTAAEEVAVQEIVEKKIEETMVQKTAVEEIAQEEVTLPAAQQTTDIIPSTPVERVIIDEDRDAVPWISAFGIVTVLTSAFVFLRIKN